MAISKWRSIAQMKGQVLQLEKKGGKQAQNHRTLEEVFNPLVPKTQSSNQQHQHPLETCKKMQIIRPKIDLLSQNSEVGPSNLGFNTGSVIWTHTRAWEPLIQCNHCTDEKDMKPVTSFNSFVKLVTKVTGHSSQWTFKMTVKLYTWIQVVQ